MSGYSLSFLNYIVVALQSILKMIASEFCKTIFPLYRNVKCKLN